MLLRTLDDVLLSIVSAACASSGAAVTAACERAWRNKKYECTPSHKAVSARAAIVRPCNSNLPIPSAPPMRAVATARDPRASNLPEHEMERMRRGDQLTTRGVTQ